MNRSVMMTVVACGLLVSLPLALSGCSSAEKADHSMNAVDALLGEWNLTELEGDRIDSLLPAGMRKPNINIGSDGRLSGFGGVNQLSSALDLEKLAKGDFSIGPMISTKMAGPVEAMNVETRFTEALEKVSGFMRDGNALNLMDGKKTLLRFIKG